MNYLSAYFIIIYIVVGIYFILCFALIAKQAGYRLLFGILIIVPVLNLIVLGTLAFEKWPITRLYIKQQQRLIKLMNLVSTSVCEKCGATINEQDKFCSMCGIELKT